MKGLSHKLVMKWLGWPIFLELDSRLRYRQSGTAEHSLYVDFTRTSPGS